MYHKATLNKIQFEINQVDKLLNKYKDLIQISKEKEPDLVELTAFASVLHSFYNGIENIFLVIAKGIDNSNPSDSKWHKELLIKMSGTNKNREAIISEDLKNKIIDYLGFRHFYRHSYSFYLDWKEMEKLVSSLFDVWNQMKQELNKFIDNNWIMD